MRFQGALTRDEVNLVLHDHDVLDARNFERHQVFTRLRLRACFVCGHHQQGAVHQGCAGDHDGHQRLVTGSVNERHHALEVLLDVFAALRVAAERVVRSIIGLVEGRVRVAQLDRNAALAFLGVGVGPNPRQRLGQGRLSVVDVTDESDVDLRLAWESTCHRSLSFLSCSTSLSGFTPRPVPRRHRRWPRAACCRLRRP